MVERDDYLLLLLPGVELPDFGGNTHLVETKVPPQKLLGTMFDHGIGQRMA
jgi:hypothetical protein